MFSPGSRLQFSPSTVIASLALFFALGGGAAVAAQQFINGSRLTPHTVGFKQLSPQVLAALNASKNAAAKTTSGAQGPPGATGATGSPGPAGLTGSTGPAGPAGTPSSTGGYTPKFRFIDQIASAGPDSASATMVECPKGYIAVGGGGGLTLGVSGGAWDGGSSPNALVLQGSSPHSTNGGQADSGWSIWVLNTTSQTVSYPIYADCIMNG